MLLLQHLARFMNSSEIQGCCGGSGVRLYMQAAFVQWSWILIHTSGLLPIYQWLTSLERMHPPTRKLLTIERLQGWSMIAYYPLEHLYYLRAHAILPAALALPFLKKSIPLNTGKIGLWSTRFWAAYVFLQFAHLREDHQLLRSRERALNKVKGKGKASDEEAEKTDLARRWDALLNELVVNLGYLPLTLHWYVSIQLFTPITLLFRHALLVTRVPFAVCHLISHFCFRATCFGGSHTIPYTIHCTC